MQQSGEDQGAGDGTRGAARNGRRPPVVRVRLEPEQGMPHEFVPLKAPTQLDVQLGALSPDQVEELSAELRLELREGRYELPLGHRLPVLVDVPGATACKGWVSIGRTEDEPKAMITGASLSFERPLVIRNVLPILRRLPTLFEDRQLRAVLETVAELSEPARRAPRVRRLARLASAVQDWIGPDPERLLPDDSRLKESIGRVREAVAELQQQPERLVTVLLHYVAVRPIRRAGQWRLELRFSGEITYLGHIEVPFHEIVVPRPILPEPHALLERLLSTEPLASAVVRKEMLTAERLVEALSDVVAQFEGSFAAHLELPAAEVQIQLADGGELQLDATSRAGVRTVGTFEGHASSHEISLRTRDLEIRSGDHRLGVQVDTTLRASGLDGAEPADGETVARRWLGWARRLEWPPPGLDMKLSARIDPGSTLGPLDLRIRHEHPLMKGGADLPLELTGIELGGEVAMAITPASKGWPRHRGDIEFAAAAELPPGGTIGDGRTELQARLNDGRLAGRAQWTDDQGLDLQLRGDGGLALDAATHVEAFPELAIDEGVLASTVRGRASLNVQMRTGDLTQPLVEADFGQSELLLVLEQADLELGPRQLVLPPGSSVSARIDHAVLATSGLGRGAIKVSWDLQGRSAVLRSGDEQIELLVPGLRQGRFALELSPAGGMTISGEERGLYDARFFNALVNPGSEPQRWLDILLDDVGIEHLLVAVGVFSQELASLLRPLRRFALDAREALEDEGIEQPRDGIPGPAIARVLSRLLCGSTRLSDELYPLVKQVTDGDGLDVPAVKRILNEHLPEHDYDYELDRALRFVAPLLGPTEPLPPRRRVERPALVHDPRFAAELAELPSAAELYGTVDADEPLPEGFALSLARIAPYLTVEQLDYLLGRPRDDWPTAELGHLRYVLELKQRVQLIRENYGGVSFAPQALAIGFFLGEAARIREVDEGPQASESLPTTVLGPEEVAVLLQAGLASAWQGRVVQLNRCLLFELCLSRPRSFLLEVLAEMAGASPRALAGVLYAILAPAQDMMREPLDMVAVLSERLGVALPRLADYMAGGRWAKHSYWEALAGAAEQILERAEPYAAKKAHLQVCRHPDPEPLELDEPQQILTERAQQAVAHADALGARCDGLGSAGVEPLLAEARRAYETAFDACRALLDAAPEALQLPWFKAFWARNYEALMVLSVVRNAQQDVDDVRRWLTVRTGFGDFDDEQRLVVTVLEALYYRPEDRAQLWSDPLVRLLIDPPPGRYDFTIISAMGVITEGAQGTELEDAYRRLEEQRGVKTLRANTATARSLEYNAARIEEAARRSTTPWGYIGYSQGCANGMQAESRLLGGSPEQQQLAERLVARNLLFSATNGSAHGTCGDQKFLRAMIEGDRFLKHYQAVFSRQVIRFVVDNLKLLLDSRLMVHVLGGIESLSYEGLRPLGRDGQFKGSIATCSIRGIVETETMPEALEFLSNVLTKQLESTDHDTQVHVDEAVGHPIQIDNPSARLLERCDMGALVQRTHHWSPLHKETDLLTTERDRGLRIYDFPKDRHVFPWVEVNARFGLIKRMAGD